MIKLGLNRISLLANLGNQHLWRTVHIAGTNGKGSICAYISRLLRVEASRRVADFTSPSLIDAWDGIKLQGRPISEQAYSELSRAVDAVDRDRKLNATPFERMTAAAIELFQRERVEYAVVEVGLGGATDATNILENKALTVISKIGLDHQGFLGDTLEEIALNKAGIMRPGVPCVVDGSNAPEVLEVLRRHARDVGTDITVTRVPLGLEAGLLRRGLPQHQIQNMACAVYAYHLLKAQQPSLPALSPLRLLRAVRAVSVPGRLQAVDIAPLCWQNAAAPREALLDGAHNVQSAEVLAAYVDRRLRGPGGDGAVTWVVSMSAGKDHGDIIRALLRPQDHMVATCFAEMPDMPWVRPEETRNIIELANRPGFHGSREVISKPRDAVRAAASNKTPIVIAGSLYLVRNILYDLRVSKNAQPEEVRSTELP